MTGHELQQAALNVAISEMNAGACEVGGNNMGPWVKKYLDCQAPEGSAWCASFVSYCFREAWMKGGKLLPYFPPYEVSARKLYNWFRKRGWIYDRPEVGDLIFFWRGNPGSWMGHVGFVVSVEVEYKEITTIEGNVGPFPAKVQAFEYRVNNIAQLLGYGRLP